MIWWRLQPRVHAGPVHTGNPATEVSVKLHATHRGRILCQETFPEGCQGHVGASEDSPRSVERHRIPWIPKISGDQWLDQNPFAGGYPARARLDSHTWWQIWGSTERVSGGSPVQLWRRNIEAAPEIIPAAAVLACVDQIT